MRTNGRNGAGPLGVVAWCMAVTVASAEPAGTTAADGTDASATTPPVETVTPAETVTSVEMTTPAETVTPATSASVRNGEICRGVDRATRSAQEPGTEFPGTVGELTCLTTIDGAAGTTIVHVWKQGSAERARVSLAVGGPGWRTWSTKRVPATALGEWTVDVEDASGNVMRTIPFRVTAASLSSPEPPAAGEESVADSSAAETVEG